MKDVTTVDMRGAYSCFDSVPLTSRYMTESVRTCVLQLTNLQIANAMWYATDEEQHACNERGSCRVYTCACSVPSVRYDLSTVGRRACKRAATACGSNDYYDRRGTNL